MKAAWVQADLFAPKVEALDVEEQLEAAEKLLHEACDLYERPTTSAERAAFYARVRKHLGRNEP